MFNIITAKLWQRHNYYTASSTTILHWCSNTHTHTVIRHSNTYSILKMIKNINGNIWHWADCSCYKIHISDHGHVVQYAGKLGKVYRWQKIYNGNIFRTTTATSSERNQLKQCRKSFRRWKQKDGSCFCILLAIWTYQSGRTGWHIRRYIATTL